MKFRNPKTLRLVTWIAHKILSIWLKTLRIEFRAIEHDYRPDQPYMKDGKRVIYSAWHEYLTLPAVRFCPQNLTTLVSEHRDGEIIAQILERFGINVVRGSTTRKAVTALLGMLRAGTLTHLGITPDGPKGPRRVAQAGAVYLAWKTGLELVPLGVSFAKLWRAKSWDRLAIPKPFTRCRIVFGKGIQVPAETTSEGLKEYLARFQKEMDRATRLADHWIQTKSYDPDV